MYEEWVARAEERAADSREALGIAPDQDITRDELIDLVDEVAQDERQYPAEINAMLEHIEGTRRRQLNIN
jgi:hypothetical protein